MDAQNGLALVREAQTWRLNFAIRVAATALLLHDYTLTFADEVRCIWRRRLSGVTIIFIILRYAPLLKQGLSVLLLAYPTDTSHIFMSREAECRSDEYELSCSGSILHAAGICDPREELSSGRVDPCPFLGEHRLRYVQDSLSLSRLRFEDVLRTLAISDHFLKLLVISIFYSIHLYAEFPVSFLRVCRHSLCNSRGSRSASQHLGENFFSMGVETRCRPPVFVHAAIVTRWHRSVHVYMPDEVSTSYAIPSAVIGNVGAPSDMRSIEDDFHSTDDEFIRPGGKMEAASLVEDSRIDVVLLIFATTLQVYDYLLTLPKEVQCIWRRKHSGATFIFLTMRYVPLVIAIFTMLQEAYCSSVYLACSTCEAISRLQTVLTVFPLLSMGLFCALRVYAIGGKDLKKAAFVLILVLVDVCLNAYVDGVPRGGQSGAGASTPSCVTPDYTYLSPKTAFILGNYTSRCQIVTWMKTAQVRQTLKRLKQEQPLIKLLLRDGTFGFMFLAIFSLIMQLIVGPITFFVAPIELTPRTSGQPTSEDLSILTLPFLSIMMCRFMLNLRQVYLSDDSFGGSTQAISVPVFIVGNLGAPLDISSAHDITFNRDNCDAELDDDSIVFSSDPLGSGLQLPHSLEDNDDN
ncbi:hypothetical protein NM688_g2100 [Phlebia brevispora]|uniref:Uncharacterized protein n=1 Tax=Phlebia brevispora TaxID=194682 RepID=A0ACC1T9Q3_9APHY|nr:hypothetical protein NM688_g2100 [Phlebia brevispora]